MKRITTKNDLKVPAQKQKKYRPGTQKGERYPGVNKKKENNSKKSKGGCL